MRIFEILILKIKEKTKQFAVNIKLQDIEII